MKKLSLIVKIAVSVGILGGILWKMGGVSVFLTQLGKINPGVAVLVIAVNILDRAIMTYKWGLLLKVQRETLPFLQGLTIYCSCMIWGMFLPATVGADLLRAYLTSRTGISAHKALASIVVERMVGFVSVLCVGLFSLWGLSMLIDLDRRWVPLFGCGIAVLLGTLILTIASFHERTFGFLYSSRGAALSRFQIIRKFRIFQEAYSRYRNYPGTLLFFFGLSIIEQTVAVLSSWLIAQGMGIPVSLLFVAAVLPLTLLIARLPISIDGLGVFDGIFVLLMSFAGISPASAVAIAFAGRILQVLAWLPGWGLYVLQGHAVRPPDIKSEFGQPADICG